MRHGQTVWNERGISQGRRNNRLSKCGIKVTQDVAKTLKDIPFDVIFSSPLMRTMQTANIVNQYHHVKIIKDDDLIEIDQGIFAGRKKDSLSQQEQLLRKSRSKAAGMESYQHCLKRTKNFVERLKKTNFKNVLVVTHYRAATFIEDIVCGNEIDFLEIRQKFENSQVKKFELKCEN